MDAGFIFQQLIRICQQIALANTESPLSIAETDQRRAPVQFHGQAEIHLLKPFQQIVFRMKQQKRAEAILLRLRQEQNPNPPGQGIQTIRICSTTGVPVFSRQRGE